MRKRIFCLCITYFSTIFNISALPTPQLVAEGAILIEPSTNTIFVSKNAFHTFYPASTTKVLTALLLAEEILPDLVITKSADSVAKVPSDSSHIGLRVGDSYHYNDGLYAILLGSDNFVSHDMAIANAGSIEAFAHKMNERVASIGALNSHFVNPHGYHDPNHYSTPYDLALITKEAFDNPIVAEIAGTTHHTLPILGTDLSLTFKNGSPFFNDESDYYTSYITSSKTGFHTPAGRTLVAKATYNGLDLIAVVTRSESPAFFSDIISLFEYGFNNFEWVESPTNTHVLNNKSYSEWAYPYIAQSIFEGTFIPSLASYMDPTVSRDFIALLQNSLPTIGLSSLDDLSSETMTSPHLVNQLLTPNGAQSILSSLAYDLGFKLPTTFVNDALNLYHLPLDSFISLEQSIYLSKLFMYTYNTHKPIVKFNLILP